MKAFAVAGVLILVLVAGIMDWLDHSHDPAPGKRVVRLWEENWNKGNYTVPACAKHWPTTCPSSTLPPVRACARNWPPTCKDPK